jgi:mRNA interferase MazF
MREVFYAPERGDIVRIAHSPAADGASPEERLVAIASPQAYNARVGLAIACPVVAAITGYPFEVPLPADLPVAGVILADRAVSLDWRVLRAERVCSLPAEAVEEVLGKLRALLA